MAARHGFPVLRFTYAYDCPGSVLDGETIEVEDIDESTAYKLAREKLARGGMTLMKLRLVSLDETGRRRAA
jgi:hypothetical protein